MAAGGWIWSYAHAPSPAEKASRVLIPEGAGVRQIMTLLDRQGIVDGDIRFLLLAGLTDTAGRLRAGEYLVQPGQTPLQILRLLERGEVIRYPVTIPEGKTIRQVADILAEGGWIDRRRFLDLTRDPGFIRSLGLQINTLEGYLFPDTYILTRDDISEERLISLMVNRFLSIWNTLAQPSSPALSRHQVITLASIIEKETAAPEERPLIAGVFLNRLEKNMRLQSDPTVIYGLPDFNGNLTRRDLTTPTAYNTYVITGLPPGPICNPGKDSIAAALQPARVPYLYFVSKNDTTHHFSTSLKEHNRAVRKYQRSRGSKNLPDKPADHQGAEKQFQQSSADKP
jgi:UPF0755 protein